MRCYYVGQAWLSVVVLGIPYWGVAPCQAGLVKCCRPRQAWVGLRCYRAR